MRACILVVVLLLGMGTGAASLSYRWDIAFQVTRGGVRCNLPAARLVVAGQSAYIERDVPSGTSRIGAEAKVITGEIVEIKFEMEDGVRIVMLGDAGAPLERATGTWDAKQISCEGTWVAQAR